jgi:hypothetical protein
MFNTCLGLDDDMVGDRGGLAQSHGGFFVIVDLVLHTQASEATLGTDAVPNHPKAMWNRANFTGASEILE